MEKDKKGAIQKNNKNAIIAFVLSVISPFAVPAIIGMTCAIAGVIFAVVAIIQIRHTQEKGKAWAIAAIVIQLMMITMVIALGIILSGVSPH